MLFVALLVIWVVDSVAFDCCDCGFLLWALVWFGWVSCCFVPGFAIWLIVLFVVGTCVGLS